MGGQNILVAGSILLAVSFSTKASSQPTIDEELQAAVVAAVAQALGADPVKIPDYNAELRAARRTADTATLCGPKDKAQFLTPEIADKVIARALELLKQQTASISERPRYFRDLIVTSAISFEAGRLAGTSEEDRSALCSG